MSMTKLMIEFTGSHPSDGDNQAVNGQSKCSCDVLVRSNPVVPLIIPLGARRIKHLKIKTTSRLTPIR